MSDLVWTTDRPTVPGWYWMRCSLVRGTFCGFFDPCDGEYYPGYEFAGPIPSPAEPRPAPAEGPEQGASESG